MKVVMWSNIFRSDRIVTVDNLESVQLLEEELHETELEELYNNKAELEKCGDPTDEDVKEELRWTNDMIEQLKTMMGGQMKDIYFAHPIKTYGTEEALAVYRALQREYPDHKIIDPEEMEVPRDWESCQRCEDQFFPAIDRCEKLALQDLSGPCGDRCNSYFVRIANKELLHIDTSDPSLEEIEFEPITWQELLLMDSVRAE